tara:strand:+ start:474 stop:818 length:345 start_codon:yes stop_codon:yes gene_type:complete
MQKRLNRKRTRFTDSVAVSFRTGAAIDVIAEVTKQNKKDVANALIWKALQADPVSLEAVLDALPQVQPQEAGERSTIDWGRDAADMSTDEKDEVLASCERQSDRITDLLIKISS